MDEAALVRLLAGNQRPDGALDYDDDVALLGDGIVASVDMLVEGVDFRAATFSAEDIGHKALAVSLSDLAAAGARPLGFLQALALPVADAEWIAGYARGTASFSVPLLGGDLSSTPGALTIAITVFGATSRLLRRRATHVGDVLLVSGPLGAAAAGLHAMERGIAGYPRLEAAQRRPVPRLALGQWLAGRQEVRGAIDLSDGLAADLPRFLRAGQGAAIERVPIAPDAERLDAARALEWATRGGEDFELLIAADGAERLVKDAQAEGYELLPIGRVTGDGRLPDWGRGFDHFDRG